MIELIPAIDIINGECVRLTKGDYSQKKVYGKPIDMAAELERTGFKRLHMVDLDGAKSKHVVNANVLNEVCKATNLTVDFGGGIKTQDDMDTAFDNGASMVTIGSISYTNPQMFSEWLKRYGPERIILGADVLDGRIAINGWLEHTERDIFDFIGFYKAKGVSKVLCTDISKDGTLSGVNAAQLDEINKACSANIIASGGVHTIDDIITCRKLGLYGTICGKSLYQGTLDLKQALQEAQK